MLLCYRIHYKIKHFLWRLALKITCNIHINFKCRTSIQCNLEESITRIISHLFIPLIWINIADHFLWSTGVCVTREHRRQSDEVLLTRMRIDPKTCQERRYSYLTEWTTRRAKADTRMQTFCCVLNLNYLLTKESRAVSLAKPTVDSGVEGNVTDLWIRRRDGWHLLSFRHLPISPSPSCENKVCLLQTTVAVRHLHSENQSAAGKKRQHIDNNGRRE